MVLGAPLIVVALLGIFGRNDEDQEGLRAVAARGMGMRGAQTLWRVELPNALPLIFSGIRSSFLQVIATATVTAYVSLGGLGRYLIDGLAQRDYPQMASGAVLVASLALLIDLVLATIQRFSVSRGISGRYANKRVLDPAEQPVMIPAVAD